VTRNRKIDPEVLEREYIYDAATPAISFTQLAEKHGLARTTVAEKAIKGRWFERREEFRRQLGIKATAALGEEWVRFETAAREKSMNIGMKVLDKFDKQLEDPDFKVSTRDMVAVAAMIRTLAADAALAKGSEEVLLDPDTSDIHPDEYRRALGVLDRITAGAGPGAGDAEAPAPAGPEGAGED
jgi:hypothetical protein